MSNWNWNQIRAVQDIYNDRLREAERVRVLWQVPEQRERRDRRIHRVASWLGQRLVTWGWRLQERCAAGAVGGGVGAHNPGPVSGCARANCSE